jgi:hypothetical protein
MSQTMQQTRCKKPSRSTANPTPRTPLACSRRRFSTMY